MIWVIRKYGWLGYFLFYEFGKKEIFLIEKFFVGFVVWSRIKGLEEIFRKYLVYVFFFIEKGVWV